MIRAIRICLLAAILLLTFPSVGQTMQGVGQGEADNCGQRYTVKAGESLRDIARRCGTTVSMLLFENPLIDNAGTIYPGQEIFIPARVVISEQPASASIPVTGNQQAQEEQTATPIVEATSTPEAAQEVTSTPGAVEDMIIYRVKPGDRLSNIAKSFEVTLDMILLANPEITNPNRIYVNQELRIPGAEHIQALMEERERREMEELNGIVTAIGQEEARWIDVDLENQKVRAFEGQQLVQTFTVSTGTWRTPTVTGQYRIWIKLESDDMSGPGYYLENVPYVMYFYKGYGLHGTYWHNNFGTPMSHGCVNLTTDDARWLFEFADVGTLVNVH